MDHGKDLSRVKNINSCITFDTPTAFYVTSILSKSLIKLNDTYATYVGFDLKNMSTGN